MLGLGLVGVHGALCHPRVDAAHRLQIQPPFWSVQDMTAGASVDFARLDQGQRLPRQNVPGSDAGDLIKLVC